MSKRLARPLTDLTRVRLSAPTAVSPVARGLTVIGVRAANDVGRCASRGSTAAIIMWTATPCSVSDIAIDDALE